MNLLSVAVKDLTRRKARSALTIAGIALAAATLFSLLSFNRGFHTALKKEMADSGIHMFVSTEGCAMEAASLALHGGEIPKFLPESRVPAIRAVPGIRAVTSMLIFSTPGEGRRTDLFYGVDDEYRKLKPHWKIKGSWFKDERSVILGAEAALVEKRNPGDRIFFPEIDQEFIVSGVLERTGSEDDGFFFLPLKTAQRVFKKEGKLTDVGVNLGDVEKIQQVKDGIERIPDVYVVTAQQMMDQILKLIGSSKTLMFAVLFIALIIAVLGVLNTVLMSVMEQLHEFGYMRCVGASPLQVFSIVLVQTLVLCTAGGIVGVTAGAAIARALINQPLILLADEPTGSLDSATAASILDLFLELNREGLTIAMVTHNQELASAAHRAIHLRDGRIAGDERLARA